MRSLIWFCVLVASSAEGLAQPAQAAPRLIYAAAHIAAENTLLVASQQERADASTNASIAETLLYAFSLIGVKYRYGGKNADTGFDCSGFIRHVFAETLALALPHSAYAMSKLGNPIENDGLEPGDLVFYKTRKHAFSHVGLYIGDGRFVHAPSRGKTVEIVDMDNTYWRKRFNGARRLIAAPSDSGSEISSPSADSLKPATATTVEHAITPVVPYPRAQAPVHINRPHS